jgi:hypothetical protein
MGYLYFSRQTKSSSIFPVAAPLWFLHGRGGATVKLIVTSSYLMACKYSPLGTPRGMYDEHSSKSSMRYGTKV